MKEKRTSRHTSNSQFRRSSSRSNGRNETTPPMTPATPNSSNSSNSLNAGLRNVTTPLFQVPTRFMGMSANNGSNSNSNNTRSNNNNSNNGNGNRNRGNLNINHNGRINRNIDVVNDNDDNDDDDDDAMYLGSQFDLSQAERLPSQAWDYTSHEQKSITDGRCKVEDKVFENRVTDTVRCLLFRGSAGLSIKKSDITASVFKGSARNTALINAVIHEAKLRLEKHFGLTVVRCRRPPTKVAHSFEMELAKQKEDRRNEELEDEEAAANTNEATVVNGTASDIKGTGDVIYILKNMLRCDATMTSLSETHREGSIDDTKADVARKGLLIFVLGLIDLAIGQILTEKDLKDALDSVGISDIDEPDVQFGGLPAMSCMAVIRHLVKQDYLEKIVFADKNKAEVVAYRKGNRSKIEIDEEAPLMFAYGKCADRAMEVDEIRDCVRRRLHGVKAVRAAGIDDDDDDE